VGDWVRDEMGEWIGRGVLNYYRTEEPRFYSMAHSRNIGFKVATGEIVHSVDADSFTNRGFASYTNALANEQPQKAIFAKGRKMLRGRLGFYRDEFINGLGGYSEYLRDYGSEDHDIMHRAWGLGYRLMWWGGAFYDAVPEHRKHQTENYFNKSWRYTEKLNKVISCFNLCYGIFKANHGVEWGKARLEKNFTEEVRV